MKILQLCKKFPYPQKDGESIAIANLSKSLVELGCEVHLLAMNTSKHYVDLEKVQDETAHYEAVYAVEVDNALRPLDAVNTLLKGKSYHISRFESKAYSDNLKKLLERENFDIIQLETLYLAPYLDVIRENSDAVIAMRAHNVEHEIWERITSNTSSFPKKWYLSLLTSQLKSYEISNLNKYDLLIAISDADLQKFKSLGYKNGAISTPVGLNLANYSSSHENASSTSFSFIGSLDWQPNIEGLNWYLDKVHPQVNNGVLHIAGRNTPKEIFELQSETVKVHGEVASAMKFIDQHQLMIVPLLSGSGMRVKILEGMAMGKTVITTSKGLEGIEAVDGDQVLVADDENAFADKVNWAIQNPVASVEIGGRAQAFIRNKYNSRLIAESLLDAYRYVTSDAYTPIR